MISTRSARLLIDTVISLTLAKWETVSGRFGGYLNSSDQVGRAENYHCHPHYGKIVQPVAHEANPDKILDATAPGYRFRDPFVGSFSRRSLHEYFALLQDRLLRAGTIRRPD